MLSRWRRAAATPGLRGQSRAKAFLNTAELKECGIGPHFPHGGLSLRRLRIVVSIGGQNTPARGGTVNTEAASQGFKGCSKFAERLRLVLGGLRSSEQPREYPDCRRFREIDVDKHRGAGVQHQTPVAVTRDDTCNLSVSVANLAKDLLPQRAVAAISIPTREIEALLKALGQRCEALVRFLLGLSPADA
jgi:hypothetical protein